MPVPPALIYTVSGEFPASRRRSARDSAQAPLHRRRGASAPFLQYWTTPGLRHSQFGIGDRAIRPAPPEPLAARVAGPLFGRGAFRSFRLAEHAAEANRKP